MRNPFDFDKVDDTIGLAAEWARSYRSWLIDLLRIYVGIALFVRGVWFLSHVNTLLESIGAAGFAYSSSALAHLIAAVHICGGILLACGLLTRFAALIQIPILFGAVFFVHLQEGLFTPGQGLELAGLVLINLIVIAIYGPGVLSLDHAMFARSRVGESQNTTYTITPDKSAV